MEPVLFYGVPQGCSLGSIVALEWLGQPYRLSRVEMLEHPWDVRYERVNPLYKTPALVLEDGTALSQSPAILGNLAARGIDQRLGFEQGTRDFDRFNQMLAFLNCDLFSAFGPHWTLHAMPQPSAADRALLQRIGREGVAEVCAHLETLLKDRDWLLGARRTMVDAYFTGIGRWIGYFELFDLAREYPRLHAYLQRLDADPAVRFAKAIEKGEPVTGCGAFRGHLTLDELMPRLAA